MLIPSLLAGAAALYRFRPGKKKRVLGVIPARYGSTRFPAKPLKLLAGKPMVYHTYTNAAASKTLDYVCVATDDERIAEVVRGFGGNVVMTDINCNNGTERCLEVLSALKAKGEKFDIVVNIQGDEPFIEAHHIDVVASVVRDSEAVMGTLARPATGESDVMSVNNVKTVLDVNGYALYFSRGTGVPIPEAPNAAAADPRAQHGRALIPHNKKGTYDKDTHYWRKLGIYSYRADFLPKFITMPVSLLQKAEDLEQNKVIEAGFKIKVGIVQEAVHGVDTPQQLDDLNDMIKKGTFSLDLPSLAHIKK